MSEPEEKITALNLPEMDPMPDHVKKYFKLCKDKLGLIPNVLKAYSFNETKLNAFTNMYNDLMLGESNISPLEREMIAVVVSSINRCYYCLVAHGNSVRKLSKNPALGGIAGYLGIIIGHSGPDLIIKGASSSLGAGLASFIGYRTFYRPIKIDISGKAYG